MTLIIVFGIVCLLAIIPAPKNKSGQRSSGSRGRSYNGKEKPYGLPWMGGSSKRKKSKYFWDS